MTYIGRQPGFYDDPDSMSGNSRYWDGSQWTGDCRAPDGSLVVDTSVDPGKNPLGMRRGVRQAAIGVLVLLGLAVFASSCVKSGPATLPNVSQAAGKVTSVTTNDQASTGRECRLEYSFTVDGADFTGRTVDPGQTYCDVRLGGSLFVEYDPADPTRNSPARGRSGRRF